MVGTSSTTVPPSELATATLELATKICSLLTVISSLVAVNRNLPRTRSLPASIMPASVSESSAAFTTVMSPTSAIVTATVAAEFVPNPVWVAVLPALSVTVTSVVEDAILTAKMSPLVASVAILPLTVKVLVEPLLIETFKLSKVAVLSEEFKDFSSETLVPDSS